MWISTDAANAKAVYDALREFGAPLADLSAADFAQEGYFYQMGVPPVRVDILMGIPGVAFEEAWPKRMTMDFDGLEVAFIARDDLIMAKRAAGRPQDLLDAEALSQVRAKTPKHRRVKPAQSKRE